jgi:hypothetical protein
MPRPKQTVDIKANWGARPLPGGEPQAPTLTIDYGVLAQALHNEWPRPLRNVPEKLQPSAGYYHAITVIVAVLAQNPAFDEKAFRRALKAPAGV